MISHHDQCVFVHVPKCAGQSIESFFIKRVGLSWEQRAPLLLRPNHNPELGPPRLAHLKAREYVEKKWLTQQQFDTYYRFAFVRNPWDRTASFYRTGYDRVCSFSRFVRFQLPRLMERKPWFFGPQADYLHDDDGRLLVDFVGRYERLAADFGQVCKQLDIPDATLPHANDSNHGIGRIARWLRRRPRPYTDMYDSRSRTAIARLYGDDVDAFKYRFHEDRGLALQRTPRAEADGQPAAPPPLAASAVDTRLAT
ncbi:sulfotransferase family 2 domain-containing protein [Cognatiluteimonas profundi]|uniref:sulfotransferase family 2 domain-containing protein n=1 Tax=Cognatiluteimonas profundi TaxID=2594501 RepID=UPI00131E97A1|nr:sulfotransferase family 2 domain-containing protein [Lysobacter profundi]